ncbi:MAG: fasciclin domain-containing protein [Bacteroidales bacterium]|nr:fasciclin domain-containing protein [Bacteroidales bacterium]
MKSISIIASIFAFFLFTAMRCEEPPPVAEFEDMKGTSIYNFVLENDTLYGKFLKVLDATVVGGIVSAYNPYNSGYTLFLPDDQAMDDFIAESDKYNSIDELINDMEYATALAKYHVVNLAIDANDFPYGALPARTLSGDLLTVNYVLLEDLDSAYYNINNQAPVKIKNYELSNGFVHVLSKALKPITRTTMDWVKDDGGFSIFAEAAEMTGQDVVLTRNLKVDTLVNGVTLLVEHDTTYSKKGIYNVQDLLDTLGVSSNDYTNVENGLYQYIGYHILDANVFLDDFVDNATNFTTFSNFPVNINGNGLDIVINRGKQVFDTLIEAGDTVIIDFIGFNYDASNVITQSGAIHLIDRMMTPQRPTRATVTFEFYEEPLFNEFRLEPGEYIVEDPAALSHITWTGPDLLFVEEADEAHTAWGDDYLKIVGDFSIRYNLPKIVQGSYEVHIRAHAFSELNALVEVYIDIKRVGGLLDLSEGGSSNWPYHDFYIGNIDFNTYERHEVEVRSLIPGVFEWDYVRFEPLTNKR